MLAQLFFGGGDLLQDEEDIGFAGEKKNRVIKGGLLQLRLSHLQTWLAHTGMHWVCLAPQHSKVTQCSCTLVAGLG